VVGVNLSNASFDFSMFVILILHFVVMLFKDERVSSEATIIVHHTVVYLQITTVGWN